VRKTETEAAVCGCWPSRRDHRLILLRKGAIGGNVSRDPPVWDLLTSSNNHGDRLSALTLCRDESWEMRGGKGRRRPVRTLTSGRRDDDDANNSATIGLCATAVGMLSLRKRRRRPTRGASWLSLNSPPRSIFPPDSDSVIFVARSYNTHRLSRVLCTPRTALR
jgi:hypothetical protein